MIPTRVLPFALSSGLIVASMIIGAWITPHVASDVDAWVGGTVDERKMKVGRAQRAASYYSDITQLITYFAAPIFGVGLGAAKGSDSLQWLYVSMSGLTFVSVIFVLIRTPHDYGRRFGAPGVTPLATFALIVNVAAGIAAWAIPS